MPGGRLAHALQVEEVDDLLHLAAMLELLALGAGQPIQRAGDEVVPQEMVAPDHDVVEHRHVAEQGEVLKRPADPEAGAVVDRAAGERRPLGGPASMGRAGETADNVVQHRGVAGPVGADDGEHPARLHLEATSLNARTPPTADRYVRYLEDGSASTRHAPAIGRSRRKPGAQGTCRRERTSVATAALPVHHAEPRGP